MLSLVSEKTVSWRLQPASYMEIYGMEIQSVSVHQKVLTFLRQK